MRPPSPSPEQTENHDRIESADGGLWASILRILKLLWRPELAKWRPVMVVAVLLTLAASVLEVVSPLVLGHAPEAVLRPVAVLLAYALGGFWLAAVLTRKRVAA
jgi:ATP-binding cassette subfamily B protein